MFENYNFPPSYLQLSQGNFFSIENLLFYGIQRTKAIKDLFSNYAPVLDVYLLTIGAVLCLCFNRVFNRYRIGVEIYCSNMIVHISHTN